MVDIHIVTTGLALTTFTIAEVGAQVFDGADRVAVSLAPGPYRFVQNEADTIGFAFMVTAAGTVEFAASDAGYLSGRDTDTLTVTGYRVRIDTRPLGRDLTLAALGAGAADLTPDQPHVLGLLPASGLYILQTEPPGPGYRFGVHRDGTISALDPGPMITAAGTGVPTSAPSPVSALRRSAGHAEIEFDRLDALVNTDPTLAAANTAARDAAAAALTAARAAVAQAVSHEPRIWPDANPVPALLTPVRLEVRYLPNEQQPNAAAALAIRVIPDDIAVHTFEPELTDAEHDAAVTYWTTVSAPAVTDPERADAWRTILGQFGAARASWAVETLTPDIGADGAPVFPQRDRRAAAWTKAATSLLLPDRFVFRGWRGGQLVFETTGADIPVGLVIGPDPADLGDPTVGTSWSPASAWMIDFDEAVRVGMAVSVPLAGPDPCFDEIFVVGVSERDTDVAATHLAQSLQGHLYTRGLAFPPYDTPTNNTAASRSQWSTAPTMRTPEQVQAAVAAQVAGSGQPAVRLADAFGFDPAGSAGTPGRRDLLAANGGTDRDDETTARDAVAVAGAVPTKVGNDAAAVNLGWLTGQPVADFFADFVRPRGPMPALRIGRQPYGVLPVTPLSLWSPVAGEPVPDEVVTRLRLLRGFLGRYLPVSPRVGRGPDQDDVLLGLLRRNACTSAYRGADVDLADPNLPGEPNLMVGTFPQLRSRISGFTALADRGETLVDAKGIASSASKWLDDYMALLAAAHTAADVDALGAPPAAPPWFTWVAQTFGGDHALDNVGLYWGGVIAIAGNAVLWGQVLLAQLRKQQIDPPTDPQAQADVVTYQNMFTMMSSYLDVLARWEPLAEVDQGTVDRHIASVTEALTFRIDAWATALATARLHTVRAAAPTGIRLGSYGWLVDVQPTAAATRKTDNGWVMTPSLQHAASAAVLHSGWAAHSNPQAFAIDLTSDRVRRAKVTLAAIREGRTLEELLGYQLERGLHDALADDLIAPLRTAFPLTTTDRSLSLDDAHADAVRAEQARRLVVDGDAARRGAAAYLANHHELTAAQNRLLGQLFGQLDDTVDAMGDVLLAEGVHQLVGGSPLRAGLAADTVGRANPVPDRLDVVSTPRRGLAVNHTVALAVACGDPSQWPETPRAQLDPAAEALSAWVLGAPDDWQVTVNTPGGGSDVSTLADLGAAALDVIVETNADLDGSLLAARIRAHRGVDGTVRVVRSDGLGDAAALPTVAAAVRSVLEAARPTAAPTAALNPVSPGATADLAGLATRVGQWWSAVQAALAAWPGGTPQAQAQAMTSLAQLGLSGVRFDTPAAAGAALQQRWSTTELTPTAPPTTSADSGPWLAGLREAVVAAAGPWFLASPLWTAGADGWAALGGTEPADAVSGDAVEDWLTTHRDVRDGVTRITDLLLVDGALGAGVPDWLVRQRRGGTDGAPGPWLAQTHPGDRSADHLAALRIGSPDDSTRTLLVVDQWIEVVPAAAREGASVPDQYAGLGFRFDRPDARAPQAVLLVTPPDVNRGWCMEDVHAAVEETLWWTQARPLDYDDLPELRWVLL